MGYHRIRFETGILEANGAKIQQYVLKYIHRSGPCGRLSTMPMIITVLKTYSYTMQLI